MLVWEMLHTLTPFSNTLHLIGSLICPSHQSCRQLVSSSPFLSQPSDRLSGCCLDSHGLAKGPRTKRVGQGHRQEGTSVRSALVFGNTGLVQRSIYTYTAASPRLVQPVPVISAFQNLESWCQIWGHKRSNSCKGTGRCTKSLYPTYPNTGPDLFAGSIGSSRCFPLVWVGMQTGAQIGEQAQVKEEPLMCPNIACYLAWFLK